MAKHEFKTFFRPRNPPPSPGPREAKDVGPLSNEHERTIPDAKESASLRNEGGSLIITIGEENRYTKIMSFIQPNPVLHQDVTGNVCAVPRMKFTATLHDHESIRPSILLPARGHTWPNHHHLNNSASEITNTVLGIWLIHSSFLLVPLFIVPCGCARITCASCE